MSQYKIVVVGEFLSSKENESKSPFSDGLGKFAKALLSQSGINPRECYFTNVFMESPPGRSSSHSFCGTKAEGVRNLKPIAKGKYLLEQYHHHLIRLWSRINKLQPNLIIAMGDVALWATTSESSIKNSRGRIHPSNNGIPGLKVLPTWSARQIQMDYPQRPILLADLAKAKRQAEFPEIIRPQRFIHLYPSLRDMEDFYQEYIIPSPQLDCDIETKGNIITCVGFAPSKERALVVPFFSEEHKDGNYWRTHLDEYRAWGFVRRMLHLDKAVCGQNFQYDVQYFMRKMGITVPSFTDDTMLMHHAMQPEMQKGLGFLASIYTDELPWKFMHKQAANDKTGKKEDD